MYRFEGNNFEALDAPIVGQLISDGSKMYIVGNGVYQYTGLQYAVRFPEDGYLSAVALLGDGTVAMVDTLADIITEEPGNSAYWNEVTVSMHGELSALTGNSYDDFYATDGVKLYQGTGPATVAAVTWNIGSSTVRGLWEKPSGVLYAVGDDQLAMARATNGTWTPIAAPSGEAGCDLLGIVGDATTLLAAATCGTRRCGVGTIGRDLDRDLSQLAAARRDRDRWRGRHLHRGSQRRRARRRQRMER